MPKVFCHKCGGVHEKGVCPSDSIPPTIDIPTVSNSPKKSKRLCEMEEDERIIQQFYNSKEWKKKREEIIEKCFGLCQVCWGVGKIKPGKEVHHIVKIRDDWSQRLNNNNLILVCSQCHHEIEDECNSVEDVENFIRGKKGG